MDGLAQALQPAVDVNTGQDKSAKFEGRKTGWKAALTQLSGDPDALMTMFIVGNSMMQGKNPGQAMERGMLYQGQLAKLRQASEERKRKTEVEDRGYDLEKRKTATTEGRLEVAEGDLELRRGEAGRKGAESESLIGLRGAQAEKYRAETRYIDKNKGLKPGASQTLINNRAANIMERNPDMDEATAWDMAFQEVERDSKTLDMAFKRKIWGDLLGSGMVRPRGIAEMEKMLGPRPVELGGEAVGSEVSSGPVQVKSINEARALPKGTRFIDPQGNERVR